MRRFPAVFIVMVLIGLVSYPEHGLAFEVYTGKIVATDGRRIHVKAPDGNIAIFRVGWRTRYFPHRRPLIGDMVKVEYLGDVGYTVTILPDEPPQPAQPPPKESEPSHDPSKEPSKPEPPPRSEEAYPPPVYHPETVLSGELSVVKSANIRSGPGNHYPVVGVAQVGQVLELRGQTDVWYQVFHPAQEITGWVYSGLTKTVKTKPLKKAGEPKKKGEKDTPKETEGKTESKPKKAPKSDKESESGSDSKKSDKPRSL